LAFFVGVMAAAQSRINGQLAIDVHDGFLAAVISFGSGLIVVLGIALSMPGPRRALLHDFPAHVRSRHLPWWQLVGGLLGATFVAGQGLVVPLLGVALFTVLAVAGSTVSSMLTDRAGIGPGGRRPVTARRVVAAVGTVLAVALAVSGRISVGGLVVWAVVLAVVAGGMTGVQPALNGQVGAKTGEPLVAVVVNFVGGTAALLLAFGIEHAFGHAWTAPPAPWHEPVLWLGGTIGVAFILSAVIVVRPLGVLMLSLLTTAGQLSGALLSDLFFPTPGTHVSWQLVTGVVLTGLAVAFAATRPRRR
jgi:transporter family-2 protein